jgi:hypothetical protein
MTDFTNYKFRASSIGKIIPKKGKLTQGAITWLTEKWVEHKRGVRKDITSKYFDKGNLTEQDGLGMLNRNVYPNTFIRKNSEHRENEYVTGTADCIAPDGKVYDIKNAFDWWTFAKADLTWDYEWQVKTYMWLWKTDYGRLFYCLNNLPDELFADEERQLFYSGKFLHYEDSNFQEAVKDLRLKFIYDGIPEVERFKIWDLELKVDDVNRIIDGVKEARKVLQGIEDEYNKTIEQNLKHKTND